MLQCPHSSLTLKCCLLSQFIRTSTSNHRWNAALTVKCLENSSHVYKLPSEVGDRLRGDAQVLSACPSQHHIIYCTLLDGIRQLSSEGVFLQS